MGEPPPGRHVSLDGLRGYLALCVFIHHAAIWPQFLQTGAWQLPASRLLTTVGQASVALFFMLTAFLFLTRLLDRQHRIDWLRLYVSRFLRLVPLYLVCMLLLFTVVAVVSGGELRVDAAQAVGQGANWLAFTMFGAPDINLVQGTAVMVAAALWPLPNQILFYGLLPLLSLALARRTPWLAFAPVLLAAAYVLTHPIHAAVIGAFGGGLLAAVLRRMSLFRRFAATPMASVLLLACLAAAVGLFESAYAPAPLLCLALALGIVAAGSNLFGVLSWKVSRALGDLSYGIFLLHGLLLFVVFRFGVGFSAARSLLALEFSLIIAACTPLLVLAAFAVLDLVEMPLRRRTDAMNAWLRGRFLAPAQPDSAVQRR